MTDRRWFLVAALLLVVAALVTGCSIGATPTPDVPQTPMVVSGATPGAQATRITVPAADPQIALDSIEYREGATLALVNGREITWEEFEPQLRQTIVSITTENQVQWDDPAMQLRLGHVQESVLQLIVDRLLALQVAEEQGIDVSEEDVAAALEYEKSRVLNNSELGDWDAFLKAGGFTEDGFRDYLRERMLMNALLEAQDVETEAEQSRLSHIFVTDEALAQGIATELKAGRDFAELAAQYSEDTETKDKGGDLGWVPVDLVAPEIAAVVVSLEPGQFSDPIKSQSGYTIVLMMDREVRSLNAQIVQLQQQAALTTQIQAARATADIEFLVDFTADEEE